MTFKQPWYKDLKIWIGIIAIVAVLGAILPDRHKAEKELAAKLEKDSLAIVNGDIKYFIQEVGEYGLNHNLKTILVVNDSITEDQAVVLSKMLHTQDVDKVKRRLDGSYTKYNQFLYMIKTYDTNNVSDYNIVLDGPYDVIVERSHAQFLDVPKKVRGL